MTPHGSEPRSPWLGRLLLRLRPLGERRGEIEADLRELFLERAEERGRWYAAVWYCVDAASLWIHRPERSTPASRSRMDDRDISWSRSERDRDPEPTRPGGWSVASLFNGLLLDLRFAGRMFRRRTGIVSVTIAGLALTIGAATVVFGFVNAVVFPPPELGPHASSLVRVTSIDPDGRTSSLRSLAEYRRLRETARLVTLEGYWRDGALLGEAAVEDVRVTLVSGGFFETLGVRAAIGRLLTPADSAADASPAAVVNHTFWEQAYGADDSIVGRTIRLMGIPVTVVGVAEEGFVGPTGGAYPPAFWMPLESYGRIWRRDPTAEPPVWTIGRVSEEATREQAEAELSALVVALESEETGESAGHFTGVRARLEPLEHRSSDPTDRWVSASIAAVLGLLLLLACTNVANLLLANAIARRREVGVRLALGASRGRLVRQLLTESLLLGVLGGTLGLLFALWALPLVGRLADVPATIDMAPDLRVYGFVVAVTLLSGSLAGMAPARYGVRRDLATPLKGGAGVAGIGGRSVTPGRARSVLIAAQAAASVVLLILAALLTRTVVHVTGPDVGSDVDRLVLVRAQLRAAGYDAPRAADYWNRAVDRVTGLPGVERAALAQYPPFARSGYSQLRTRYEGREYRAHNNYVSEGYFTTVGIPVLRGRTFTPTEVATDAPVAIVSERLARWLWEGEDALGATLDRIEALPDADVSEIRVIGIVGDAVSRLEDPARSAALYRPLPPDRALRARLVLRARDDAATVVGPAVEAMRALDPEVLPTARTAREGARDARRPLRVLAATAGALGAIALGLAIIGIFGLTAFAVEQRIGEIGVRLAVGASSADVVRLMLRDSLRPVAAGLLAGLLIALGASRILTAILFGVSPHDPLAIAGAAAVLLAAATLAATVPTRRAARVDPVEVLSGE